jgi:MFS family permease
MSSSRTARYFDVLALPRVRTTFGAALVGRSAYALVFLPLLYAVEDATGSIALAGTAVALFGATASFLAPVRAWLIDRFGARRVLTLLVVLFAAVLAALAVTSMVGGSGVLLIGLAAGAGVVAPPLGPSMRVAWGVLAPDPALLRKGLSLDSVMEDLLYLAGPSIAGIALAFVAPGPLLFAPAGLVLVGGVLFTSTPTVGALTRSAVRTPEAKTGRPLILERRFVGLLLPVLVAGGISGTLGVAVPVVLAADGGTAAVGIALGLFAGGSVLGGLLFGALTVKASPARQLVVLSAGLLVASSAVAVASGVVVVSIVLVAAGVFLSPVMIVAYVAASTAGADHQRNVATTWVNTSHNIGGAAGSALAGVLIQLAGVTTAIGGTVAAALLLLVVSAVLGRPDRILVEAPGQRI